MKINKNKIQLDSTSSVEKIIKEELLKSNNFIENTNSIISLNTSNSLNFAPVGTLVVYTNDGSTLLGSFDTDWTVDPLTTQGVNELTNERHIYIPNCVGLTTIKDSQIPTVNIGDYIPHDEFGETIYYAIQAMVIPMNKSRGVTLLTKGKYIQKAIKIEPKLETININQNGTYESNKVGYSQATINVSPPVLSGTATIDKVKAGKTFYSNDYTLKTGTLEELDTSDANATSEDMIVGSSGYVNGVKVEGSIAIYNGESDNEWSVSVSSYSSHPLDGAWHTEYSTDNGITWTSFYDSGTLGTFNQIKFRVMYSFSGIPDQSCRVVSTILDLNLRAGDNEYVYSDNYILTQDVNDIRVEEL